jgi:hypothetical protein
MVISGKEHVFDFIDESDVYEKEPLVQSDKGFDVVILRWNNIITKNKRK